MITNVDNYILYFCTDCPTVSVKTASLFNLKKNKKQVLKCENNFCNQDIITLMNTGSKYKISLTCPICGDNHTFYISAKTFCKKDFFILNCPESGFGVIFIGKDKERLYQEYNNQQELIAGIVADNDLDYDTMEILFEIIERINSISQAHGIRCKCNSKSISINIGTQSVTLVCEACKSSVTFEANEYHLDKLMSVDKIELK